jgi:hypothetical protein
MFSTQNPGLLLLTFSGEQRRLLVPPTVTYGEWKGKAVYIDIELIKVDDKGFKGVSIASCSRYRSS